MPATVAAEARSWRLDPGALPERGRPRLRGMALRERRRHGHWDEVSSVHSPTQALLALFLFTNVGEHDAPTLALRGSHLDIAAVLGRAGDAGPEWSELEPHVPASMFERDVVAVTGQAGDVYLCHPFLVHRASWPHRGRSPRIVAQPSIWLKEPYDLHDEARALAVERAIHAGIRCQSRQAGAR